MALYKLHSGRHNDANQVDIVYDDPQVCQQCDPLQVISPQDTVGKPWIKEVAVHVPVEHYYFLYNQRIVVL